MSHPPGHSAPGEPLRLYCLAHAGGSALPYARWARWLPPTVRIEPLELPGHGSRLREPPRQRLADLLPELQRTVEAAGPAPFALFGHSFGALLGHALARRLEGSGTPPVALLVAGRNGPTRPLSHRPIHQLPHETFVAGLRRFGGLPEALWEQPELLRMYLPALRADLRMVETYTRPPGPALQVPISAFSGRQDVLTDPAGMVAWARETTGTFGLALLPGGHFFLDTPEFRTALGSALLRHAPGPAASAAWAGPAEAVLSAGG